MQRERVVLLLTISIFLSVLGLHTNSTASEAQDKAPNMKPIKIKIGYLNYAAVACRYAKPCDRPTLPQAETSYLNYLEEMSSQVQAAQNSQKTPEEIQNLISEYRSGLCAREKLWGPCPGRCGEYDFSVIFSHSTRDVARRKTLDVVIDLFSIFYGANKVTKAGTDVTENTLDELKTYIR